VLFKSLATIGATSSPQQKASHSGRLSLPGLNNFGTVTRPSRVAEVASQRHHFPDEPTGFLRLAAVPGLTGRLDGRFELVR